MRGGGSIVPRLTPTNSVAAAVTSPAGPRATARRRLCPVRAWTLALVAAAVMGGAAGGGLGSGMGVALDWGGRPPPLWSATLAL